MAKVKRFKECDLHVPFVYICIVVDDDDNFVEGAEIHWEKDDTEDSFWKSVAPIKQELRETYPNFRLLLGSAVNIQSFMHLFPELFPAKKKNSKEEKDD